MNMITQNILEFFSIGKPRDTKYKFISDAPDYRHLKSRRRYQKLYNEVGTVEANKEIKWREEWMHHFSPNPGTSILELGAHNGPNLIYYGRLGHQVDGVEISDTLIATFEKFKILESVEVQNRICMKKGWIEDYQIIQLYDYVLCTEILEHVSDPISILNTAYKAVKPEGIIYISSPTSHWGNNTHVRGVTIEDLTTWLTKANLKCISAFVENDRTFCTAKRAL